MSGASASAAGDPGRPAPTGRSGAVVVRRVSLWNVANLLTMTRLLLVPGFIVLMLAGGGYDPAWRSLAWAAFAIAMITDLFDGHLARTYDLVTDFGKIADPIADKAIMGAALICLSALGDLPWWVTGVILGREVGITLLRFWVIRYGVIPASRGGKMKTLAQGTAVGMYVLALTGPLATLRFWVMAVAVALTVVSGLDYVRQAVVLRRRGRVRERAASGAAAGSAPGATGSVPAASGSAQGAVSGATVASVDAAAPSGPAGEPSGGAAGVPGERRTGPRSGPGATQAPRTGSETAVETGTAVEAGAEVVAGERHGQEPRP